MSVSSLAGCSAWPISSTAGRCFSWTLPTNRKPFRADVRIRRCSLPLSSIAFRAALIRLVRVRLRDYSPTPYGRDEVIFADHAAAVFNQVNQKIEDLRLNRHRRAIRAQFPALAVERKIIKQKQHVAPPQSGCQIIPAGRLKRNQDFLKDKSSGAQSLSCGKGAFPRPENEWSVECKRRLSIGRTKEIGDIDRWHQEVLSRRAQTRTHFFRVARSLIGTLAILAAYISGVRMLSPLPAAAEVPDAIAAPAKFQSRAVHAVGAQVYECQYNPAGKLVWQFREPVATLLIAGKTVGRHYAGPTWEMSDGSAVSAKVLARAPGATANDIPLLKLEVTARRGHGQTWQRYDDPKAEYAGW